MKCKLTRSLMTLGCVALACVSTVCGGVAAQAAAEASDLLGAHGRYEGSITIPRDVPPGQYEFAFISHAADQVPVPGIVALTVRDPSERKLPSTGYPHERKSMLLAGVSVLVGGVLLWGRVVRSRPPRRPHRSRKSR